MLVYVAAVPNELAAAVQQVADDAALILASYAPKGRTGAIGRGIRVLSAQGRLASGRFATGRQFVIYASARNQGYDYVGVSRFGHRVKFIRPSSDRQPQSVISTKRPKLRYGMKTPSGHRARPALRLPPKQGTHGIYRNVVRGIVRPVDWVQTAQAAVDRELNAQAKLLANNLERRFG
jgi:hypothetical protein